MRVLHIIRSRRHGGPSQHVLVLARELASAEDVAVACQRGSWIRRELRKAGIRTFALRMPGSLASLAAALLLAGYVRAGRFDIVHGHGDQGALYARLATWRSRARSASTVHSLEPASVKWHARCDVVVAVSEAVASVLRARGVPTEKIRVVRHGVPDWLLAVDRQECRERVRASLGVDVSAPFAITIGRSGRLKGHDLFFEAAALVRERVPDACFALVGRRTEDFAPTLDRIAAERGLSDAVIFTGHRTDAVEIMAAADVVVLPSRSESLSQAAIEAMSVGTPVVATRVGGLPEVVASGVTGIVVEPDDVRAIADAMAGIMVDPKLGRSLGAAGRRRAEAEFLARTMAERTRAVYREVLAG